MTTPPSRSLLSKVANQVLPRELCTQVHSHYPSLVRCASRNAADFVHSPGQGAAACELRNGTSLIQRGVVVPIPQP